VSKRKPLPTLYHGTNVLLNPGQTITPPKSGPRSLTFATEHLDLAKVHADSHAAGSATAAVKPKHKDSDAAKYSQTGVVYQVEPVDPDDVRQDRLAGGSGVWISKKGFKVHSVVSSEQFKD
jgi:hypothetical protein